MTKEMVEGSEKGKDSLQTDHLGKRSEFPS
jgi:hypothetical protein